MIYYNLAYSTQYLKTLQFQKFSLRSFFFLSRKTMIKFLVTFVKAVKKVVKYLIARETRKPRYSRVASKGTPKSYMGVYTFEARTRVEVGRGREVDKCPCARRRILSHLDTVTPTLTTSTNPSATTTTTGQTPQPSPFFFLSSLGAIPSIFLSFHFLRRYSHHYYPQHRHQHTPRERERYHSPAWHYHTRIRRQPAFLPRDPYTRSLSGTRTIPSSPCRPSPPDSISCSVH